MDGQRVRIQEVECSDGRQSKRKGYWIGSSICEGKPDDSAKPLWLLDSQCDIPLSCAYT